MLGGNCRSSSESCLSPSIPYLGSPRATDNGMLPSTLNTSPALSVHSDSTVKFERTTPDQSSLFCWDSEKTLCCNHVISFPFEGTPTSKSSGELRKEIAALEVEILHLERYLLSLYRTTFEECLPALSDAPAGHIGYKKRSILQVAKIPSHCTLEPLRGGGFVDQTSPEIIWVKSNNQKSADIVQEECTKDQKNADSGHHSLANLLGTSCAGGNIYSPDRLSEDIVRCISSIYCKLANPSQSHAAMLASPTSSLSSSSIFSSQNPSVNRSPNYIEDATVHQLEGLKSGPYSTMIEIPKISLDEDSFNFAATMLQHFRSLVHGLEKVDPRKMKREEKLTFWINIHNALVMHAYLAYGTCSRVKSSSVLKLIFQAAYNVGGHCVNAYLIQSSILGIRSHYSAPWLRTLFSPARKLKTGSIEHEYALEYPEPLVHFALCSGAYSDPAVRVYRAKNIFHDLKLAKEEYIETNLYIHKEKKILLPRILYYFAKDMSLDMPRLLEIITGCLSNIQREAITKRIKGRLEKHANWLPHDSSFRYIIHGDLAKGTLFI
ncbi:putative electron transporter [Tripterygium wilfordii]|uniref:Putative electron transporter n=1 Tax=Tripterygium wilfordii TaxID=458696 RepID=A0A7J7DLM6_TRIWF|nr:uncharacterized protein LOC120001117 isoform X2 [Tripterygium wilfordii]KAF5747270.1 putative electron transporter [Tripterygium wilfordii]